MSDEPPSLKNHFIINLDRRKDRWEHISEEVKKLGIHEPNRFPGIVAPPPHPPILGCGQSHLRCLEIAQEKDWEYVVVMEDDACFLRPDTLLKQIKEILNDEEFDVLLCGYNPFGPHLKVRHNFIQVQRAYCGTMYIVKKHYYQTMIQNIKQGLDLLKHTHDRQYSWDAFWVLLQRKDTFLGVNPLSVVQKADYSDIEEKQTNYTKLMLTIDK